MKLLLGHSPCSILGRLLSLGLLAHALPSLDVRQPAKETGDQVPAVGSMTQTAGTVLASVSAPGTQTTVTFSKFTSPTTKLTQADSMVCIVEALQEIYAGSSQQYGISQHLYKPWAYSGSQPDNSQCLVMQNEDNDDHILTWGIIVEALRAVALALGNTTSTACQFDVYNQKWGHLGYGSLGYGQGDGTATA
ncbi:MAG: hypothetical protein Q9220_000788 [cf. Caloplaca sp. 1 TL-2023]